MMQPDSVTMRNVYAPTTGVKPDLKRFMNEFIKLNTVRYEQFSELWRQKKMTFLCAGRASDGEAREFVERTLLIAQDYFLSPYQFQVRIGGLYLLYAIYQTQPLDPKSKIRTTASQWEDVLFLQQQASQQNHLDAMFVFNKLIQDQAFHFCLTPFQMNTRSLINETHDDEVNLADDLKEERRGINKLFNYESVEQLSYLLDHYHRMKTSLAGPDATRPDKSLDLVQGEMSEDLLVILQAFKESVSNVYKRGHARKEDQEPTETLEATDDTGSRRRALKHQAHSGTTTAPDIRQRAAPHKGISASKSSSLRVRSKRSHDYGSDDDDANEDEDEDYLPPSLRKDAAKVEHRNSKRASGNVPKRGAVQTLADAHRKALSPTHSEAVTTETQERGPFMVFKDGVCRERQPVKARGRPRKVPTSQVVPENRMNNCLDMPSLVVSTATDDVVLPLSPSNSNGVREKPNGLDFSQAIKQFVSVSRKRKHSELAFNGFNGTSGANVKVTSTPRKGPKAKAVEVLAFKEPGKTTTYEVQGGAGLKGQTGMCPIVELYTVKRGSANLSGQMPGTSLEGLDLKRVVNSPQFLPQEKKMSDRDVGSDAAVNVKHPQDVKHPQEGETSLTLERRVSCPSPLRDSFKLQTAPAISDDIKSSRNIRVIQSNSAEAQTLLKYLKQQGSSNSDGGGAGGGSGSGGGGSIRQQPKSVQIIRVGSDGIHTPQPKSDGPIWKPEVHTAKTSASISATSNSCHARLYKNVAVAQGRSRNWSSKGSNSTTASPTSANSRDQSSLTRNPKLKTFDIQIKSI